MDSSASVEGLHMISDAAAAGSGNAAIILSSREEAVPHVVAWLSRTYSEKEGATLLKKHVYQAYVDFCSQNNFECTNAASFGKIFKRVFPRVQMARLVVDKGKKGWHYSGLVLKADEVEGESTSQQHATGTHRRQLRYPRPPQEDAPRSAHEFAVAAAAMAAAAAATAQLEAEAGLQEQPGGGHQRHRAPSPTTAPFAFAAGAPAPSPLGYSPLHAFQAWSAAGSRMPTSAAAAAAASAAQFPGVFPPHVASHPSTSPFPPSSSSFAPAAFTSHTPAAEPTTSTTTAASTGKRKRGNDAHHGHDQHHDQHHHHNSHHDRSGYAAAGSPSSYSDGSDDNDTYVPLSADIKRPKATVWKLDSDASSPSSSSSSSPRSSSSSLLDDASSSTAPLAADGRQERRHHHAPVTASNASLHSMWGSGAHLSLIETLHQYCRVFRVESWAAFPINPACLKVSNLQYLVSTDDGAQERSTLALCTYFALTCGSMIVGNLQRSREFWRRTRELLGDLFDSNEYDVACVLRYSSHVLRVLGEGEDRAAKGLYYLTVSKQICERIGAVNDENYELTLKQMGAYYQVPGVDDADAARVAAQQPRWNKRWKEGKNYVAQYKYGRITEVIKDFMMGCIKGIISATCGDHQLQDKEKMLREELVKLQRLEEATSRAEAHYSQAPRQLLQIIRVFVFFFRAVALRQVGTPHESHHSNVVLLDQLTHQLHMSSFFICWAELSFMPLFIRELSLILCALLDAGQLPLVQALFYTLEPLTRELPWMRASFDQLRAVVNGYFTVRGLAPPPGLTSPYLPLPITLPSPSDPSSSLSYLPLSSATLSSSARGVGFS